MRRVAVLRHPIGTPGRTEGRPRLRLGLLLDALDQPGRLARAAIDLASRDDATLALIVLARPEDGSEGRFLPGTRGRLLGRAYRALDGLASGLEEVSVSLAGLVEGCPILEVGRADSGRLAAIPEAIVGEIAGQSLDVVLCLGLEPRPEDAVRLARRGVWAFRLDGRADRADPAVGVREVLTGQSLTVASLHDLADPAARAVAVSHVKADRRSASRHREHLGWTSTSLVRRAWDRLAEDGQAAQPGPEPMALRSAEARPDDGLPPDREMVRLLAGYAGRAAAYAVDRLARREQWILATLGRDDRGAPCLATAGLRPLVPPRDRFWADPFPVAVGGRRHIFVEELLYKTDKGRIAALEVDRRGALVAARPALERDDHLSYPKIFEYNSNMYMIPESAAGRVVELYRCLEFPSRWRPERVLLGGLHAVDATVVERDGTWWMFVNIAPEGAMFDYEELHLFSARTPLGPWRSHRRNPIKSDARSARPAGRLFRRGGVWYRPSQDCSERYGQAIVLNRVVRWDHDGYEEAEESRIGPNWWPRLVGTHTINACPGLTVLDGLVMRPKLPLGRSPAEAGGRRA